MFFPFAFTAAQVITFVIKCGNRHITPIIAHCWICLSEVVAEKQYHANAPLAIDSDQPGGNRRTKHNAPWNRAEDVRRYQ